MSLATDSIAAVIKSARSSLAYAAPEAEDVHWQRLQENLEDLLDADAADRYRETLERIASPRTGAASRDTLRRMAREALDG